jgi:hypothetical protein
MAYVGVMTDHATSDSMLSSDSTTLRSGLLIAKLQ